MRVPPRVANHPHMPHSLKRLKACHPRASVSPAPATTAPVPHRFTLPSLTALVAASMVGAGVWTTSGFALAALGTPGRVLAAWAAGGAVALCGAVAYGGLAARVTGSGGEYLFLARTVHPLAGFLAGWVSLTAGFTAAAAFAAEGFAEYTSLGELFPRLPDRTAGDLTATAVLLLAGVLHAASVRGGAAAQTAAVAVKLVLIAAFLAYAALRFDAGGWGGVHAAVPADAPAGWALVAAFAGQLVWISLSYSGFNAAVYVAGEAEDAAVTVPRAMWVGTAVVTVLYLGLNAVFVYAPDPAAVRGEPAVAAVAARTLGGVGLETAVRAVIALALLTSVSALVQTGPRVYARMAADGLFPAAGLFGREDVPPAAVWLQVTLAVACVWWTDLAGLLNYLGLTLSVTAAATVSALFVLHRRDPVHPARLAAAALFAAATLGLAGLTVWDDPAKGLAAAATFAAGLALYPAVRFASRPRP